LKNFAGRPCIRAATTTARISRASARSSSVRNSGHDIAQDLYSSGANVTLVQRSSTLIVSIEPSAQLVYLPYNEGTLDDNDLIAVSMPLKIARKSHALTCDKSKALDTELLDGLRKIGFKLDFGEDNTGWQFKYLTRGGAIISMSVAPIS